MYRRLLVLCLSLLVSGLWACSSDGMNTGLPDMALPNTPSLLTLSISPGALSPAFSSSVTMYTATVPFFTRSVTVTATPKSAGSTVSINGVASAGGSGPVPLSGGVTMILIQVTAPGGASQSYSIAVRLAPLGPSAYIKASNTGVGDKFGLSVSLSGDTLAVGAFQESSKATGIGGNQADNSALNSGAVYVFTRSGTTWIQQAYIKASNTEAGDSFGQSVSLSGDTLAVGAPLASWSIRGGGTVYVFKRNGTIWTQQAYLKGSNTDSFDAFGWSVSLSGDTLAVGAASEASNATGINGDQTNNSAANSGAVYVFARSGTTWTQQAYIKASNTDQLDLFGLSVSLSGDTLAVGASQESSSAKGIGGDQTNNAAYQSGAAYVFTRNGTIWTQQAYLKASNTADSASFGNSVSLSGDTLAVGAPGESSNATGVGGDQTNFLAYQSGAVYVFTRSGTIWTQQAYVKASNTGAGDMFGRSVSLSGDTLAVGASSEASSATGIGGNQANNAAPNSGAVYVFTRSGTSWTQQAYLKASNTDANDFFGVSVSLSGYTLAVGAYGESSNDWGTGGDQTNNAAYQSGAVYVFQ